MNYLKKINIQFIQSLTYLLKNLSKEKISELAQFVVDGDYDSIIRYADSFSVEGLDFYRALLDLSDRFREILLDNLGAQSGSTSCSAEQCVRILDSLREGEDLVRMGLSEKTNFEVTLFRAVLSGRSRSIDQVIRQITALIPEQVKKKTELNRVVLPDLGNLQQEGVAEQVSLDEKSTSYESQKDTSQQIDLEVKEDKVSESLRLTSPVEKELSTESDNLAPIKNETTFESAESPRQVVDREKIEQKISELPDGIRDILEDKFKADFVSIEKIDEDKLI